MIEWSTSYESAFENNLIVGATLYYLQKMNFENDMLKKGIRYWTLLLGVVQVTVGCLIGLLPPDAVPYFRAILTAHLEFTANGVMMIALGLLLNEILLGRVGLWLWFFTLQIGTWSNGLSAVVSAFAGSSSQLTPIRNQTFPAPHGYNNSLAMGLLVICVITILTALFMTIYGLVKMRSQNRNIVKSSVSVDGPGKGI